LRGEERGRATTRCRWIQGFKEKTLTIGRRLAQQRASWGFGVENINWLEY